MKKGCILLLCLFFSGLFVCFVPEFYLYLSHNFATKDEVIVEVIGQHNRD